ncbi:MAG: hypothetical protein H7A52_09210 [Akkermansiaceae bacterium]|nr:hypothetical protein [Akkermansiaceae bacterium]
MRTTVARRWPVGLGPAMAGAAIVFVLAAGPFAVRDGRFEGTGSRPALFLAAWCFAEGWMVCQKRRAAFTRDVSRHPRVPWLTGLLALIIAVAATVELFRRGGPAGRAFAVAGWGVGGAGVILRLAAIRALGDRFRDDLSLGADHPIESRGLYRRLRHPAELGFGLAVAGHVILCGGAVGGVLFVIGLVPAIGWRIHAENRLLREAAAAAPSSGAG